MSGTKTGQAGTPDAGSTTNMSATTTAAPLATPQNIQDLATLLMSEASVGNDVERRAVGSTVLNRMNRNGTTSVRGVWGAYAHTQAPTPEITALAEDLLQGHVVDPTNGATHYYSPRSMPTENAPVETIANYDTGGGVEQVTGLPSRTYRPTWATQWAETSVTGARPTRYRFYKAPGTGTVR